MSDAATRRCRQMTSSATRRRGSLRTPVTCFPQPIRGAASTSRLRDRPILTGMPNGDHQARRCYGCGRPVLAGESVAVDLASGDRAFAEPVGMHERCAPAYLAVGCRDRRQPVDAATRRRLARGLRERGHTQRAIARALSVSQRTIGLDLAT